ncbi:MAG: sigma 54-interacting transcriptional regulator [Nanoarchaeota archaeon]
MTQISYRVHGASSPASFYGIVGSSPAIKTLTQRIRRVAPTPKAIYIMGETGTGKELVARAIHRESDRSGAFVPVDCGAIQDTLVEDVLFGHEKGAYTGAEQAREGAMSRAEGGTLFLDEIGLNRGLQSRLLRAFEYGYTRVGGQHVLRPDVRIIAAYNGTQEDVTPELRNRIGYVIPVPPLRERREDIPALTRYFASPYALEVYKCPVQVSEDAVDVLQQHEWPGNIRQLRHIVEASVTVAASEASITGSGVIVGPEHVSMGFSDCGYGYGASPVQPVAQESEWPDPAAILRSLTADDLVCAAALLRLSEGCSKQDVAESLGLHRTTLYRRLRRSVGDAEDARQQLLTLCTLSYEGK